MNKVILQGTLSDEPQFKPTQKGGVVGLLRIETVEHWTDYETGQPKQASQWHRTVLFGKLAETAQAMNLRKGTNLIVDGQLTTRSYVDKTGQKKWTTEVTLSGLKGSIQKIDSQGQYDGDIEVGEVLEPTASQQVIQPVTKDDFEDDLEDIPF